MKINLRKFIKPLLIILLILFTVLFLQKFWSEVKSVKIVSWIDLLPAALLFLATTVTNGLMNYFIWKEQGLNLKPKEWYGLSIVNTFANYILPMRGGLVSVAGYLKSKHSFSYTSFLGFVSATYIIIFWVNSAGAFLGLCWLWIKKDFFSLPLMLFFAGSFIFFTAILIFSPKIKEVENRWANRFVNVINDWHKMKQNIRLQYKIAFLAFLNLFLAAGMIYYQFKVLGYEVSVANSLILGVIGGFSLLLSVTPGNLGVKEALGALTSTALGIPAWQTVLVGVLDRIIGFLLVTIIAPYFLSLLSISINQKKNSRSTE